MGGQIDVHALLQRKAAEVSDLIAFVPNMSVAWFNHLLCLVNGLVVHTTCDGWLAGQDVPVDDGSGTVQVWVVHDFKLEAVDPAK